VTPAELKKAFAAGKIAKPAYIDAMNERHRLLHDYAAFIEGTDVAAVELACGEVVMTMRGTGLKFLVRRDDKRTAPLEILNFGALEKAEADMTLRLIREGDTVFDIGANIGWYALTLGRRFKRLRVHAFEPIPDTFARLRAHAALNGDKRVALHNLGFSDQRGKATFYFRPDNSVNASGADLGTGGRKVTCRIERLDDFARKTRVDFIKCDVEGAELFVFKGGLRVLARDTPVIFSEMLRKWSASFGYHPNEIIDLLGGLGYRPFTAKGRRLKPFGRMDEKTVETNFFFLHPEKHAARLKRCR
jgi:FkbM family methyltransferase